MKVEAAGQWIGSHPIGGAIKKRIFDDDREDDNDVDDDGSAFLGRTRMELAI